MEFEVSFRYDNFYLDSVSDGWPSDPKGALEASIQKWETILKWHTTRKEQGKKFRPLYGVGEVTCALCQLYLDQKCSKCPVSQSTGAMFCKNTPHTAYISATSFTVAIRQAKKMLVLLKGLR